MVMVVGHSCRQADYDNAPLGGLGSDAFGMHGAHRVYNIFSEMP